MISAQLGVDRTVIQLEIIDCIRSRTTPDGTCDQDRLQAKATGTRGQRTDMQIPNVRRTY